MRLLKSTDGGSTWTDIGASIGLHGISSLVLDPSNPSIIYMDGSAGDAFADTTFYKSTNGGLSWTGFLIDGAEESVGGRTVLDLDPSDPRIVYATAYFGLFKSKDSGLTWKLMLAPNPGEDSKPLSRIASGGELSRLVLGLKNILAAEAGVNTSIFDEVDAGIGGATATVVGQKLQRLSRRNQIVCITHLPQIACFADSHFRVEKKIEGNRTVTVVRKLDPEARLQEMARMLGGALITATTLAHAREMLAAASQGGQ
jgi:hypothetical protein